MLLGGGVCALTGALVGEFGDLHLAEFSSARLVAIALGWAILDEAVTTLTFAGAAIIVASVAAVVRTETRRSNPR